MAAPGGAMKGTLESPPAPTPLREPCSCSRESPGTPRDSNSAMMSGSFWTLAVRRLRLSSQGFAHCGFLTVPLLVRS